MLEARKELPELEHIVVVDGDAPEGTTSLADVEGSNQDFDVDVALAAVRPDDVMTLIYTSGTTGPPKGVELTHRAVLSAVGSILEMINLPPGAKVISWLPAAHIAERNAHHVVPVVYACTITICPDPRRIVEVLPQVHPTWFFAVPRVWEKLKAGLETMLGAQPEEARARVQGALDASTQAVRLRQRGQEVPAELAAAVEQADRELFGWTSSSPSTLAPRRRRPR
jgi:long-chain acyl-CoA synthetase